MRRRLLLADDSVTIQRVIELTFADENIEVIAVSDGDAALARLDADPPDVVLADVGMPGRDGYDVALHVHRTPSLAHIPVVLLIGALQPLDDQRAKEAGCAGVLIKPFEPNLVIAKVRELLKRPDGRQGSAAAAALASAATPDAAGASAPGDAPAVAPANRSAGSVDDYFARLDEAFATMEAAGEPASPRPPGAAPAEAPPAEASTDEPPAAAASPAPMASQGTRVSQGATMADAFAALLALEQGQAPSRLPDDWPSPLVDVVEAIAQRVAEQVTERVVRTLAPDIVSRVSERIVREEIERLRRELASS